MRRIQLSPLAVWLVSIVCSGLTLGVLLGLIMLAPPRHSPEDKADLNGGEEVASQESSEQKPGWSYTGSNGPEFWTSVDEGFGACAASEGQSPVDLKGEAQAPQDLELEIIKPKFTMVLRHAGPYFKGRIESQAEIAYKKKAYFLTSMAFHTPSEHSLGGQNLGAEIQFFFESDVGDELVVALFVKEGEASPDFGPLTAHLPKEFAAESNEQLFDLEGLFRLKEQTFYLYKGSATTPPCRPNVHWLVLTKPIEWDRAELNAFYEIMGKNNRPTQGVHEG